MVLRQENAAAAEASYLKFLDSIRMRQPLPLPEMSFDDVLRFFRDTLDIKEYAEVLAKARFNLPPRGAVDLESLPSWLVLDENQRGIWRDKRRYHTERLRVLLCDSEIAGVRHDGTGLFRENVVADACSSRYW